MKTVRIIALILSLVLCVAVLSACATEPAKASLAFSADEEGRFVYSIIRGELSEIGAETAAKNIRSAIKDNFGYKATLVKDNVVENVDGSCEILIGSTNRPESLEALTILTNNRTNTAYDFIVKVINNKICIQAATDDMLLLASDWFIETFCLTEETWKLLKEDYEFIYAKEYESIYNVIAGTDVGLFTVVKPIEYSYLIGMQVEEFIKFYKGMGFEIKYIEDMDEERPYEILVGNTTREESKSVTVEGDNYVIKVVGTKLVIKGGNDLATYRAVKHFLDLLKASEKEGFFNWADGYIINGKYDKEEEDVYTLNFVDEFESSRVNTDIWGDYSGEATRTSVSSLGGKLYKVDPMNESAAFTKNTGKDVPRKFLYQADGNLVMGAMRVNEKDFLGSYATTWNSLNYRYGFWEVRSKFGPAPACCSYWLVNSGSEYLESRYGDMSASGFTEIDLVENYGQIKSFGANVHRWWTDYTPDLQNTISGHNGIGGAAQYRVPGNDQHFEYDIERYGGDLSTSFNTYSFYWDDKSYKFAFNGKTFLDYEFKDNESVSVHTLPMITILSFHMGMPGYGLPYVVGESPDYCETLIDSVKIYQTAAINSQMMIGDGQWAENVSKDHTVVVYPDHPIIGSY